MPDHPLTGTPPESLRRLTLESLDRAAGYRNGAHSVYILKSRPEPNMPGSVLEQRRALMTLCESMVSNELEKELDRLVHYWTAFRSQTPEGSDVHR